MQEKVLLDGVGIIPIKMNIDNRGLLAEVYRKEWNIGCETLQWNAFYSCKNAFRGMRVHSLRIDYVMLIRGSMSLYLHDIRQDSKTKNISTTVHLNENFFQGILIPPGIVHGFYFHQDSTHLIGVSHYHDPEDEMGCRWNSPELELDLPTIDPILAERDAIAPSYEEMLQHFYQKTNRRQCSNE